MRSDSPSSGFPSHHPLPEFMKGKARSGSSGLTAAGDQASSCSRKHPKRAFFHDYCSPGFYLITATTLPGSPRLSEIPEPDANEIRKGEMIIPDNTPLGYKVKEEIRSIPVYHPEMKILRYVIMPDHIHFVLQVTERLKRMLGCELAGFFGACSKASSRSQGLTEVKTRFETFHDRVILSHEQLDRAIRYVEDNPRRYIYRKRNPDLFRRHLHLEIAEHEYAAFGNIFLLKEIHLLPVRIHRHWSETEFRTYSEYCRAEIDKGAVPITPAIHPAERAIVQYARDNGGKVIIMKDQGFEERFKPKGADFDLCCDGRLLLLAPWPEKVGRKSSSGYTEFHHMNDLAVAIARLPAADRMSLKGKSG